MVERVKTDLKWQQIPKQMGVTPKQFSVLSFVPFLLVLNLINPWSLQSYSQVLRIIAEEKVADGHSATFRYFHNFFIAHLIRLSVSISHVEEDFTFSICVLQKAQKENVQKLKNIFLYIFSFC